jgi:hypothetical protein
LKTKILKFKSLQRIIRKFPAIQWNRQNVILCHETIPLKQIPNGMFELLWSFYCLKLPAVLLAEMAFNDNFAATKVEKMK